ncbi:MAG: nucleotide exchange factor GrpE [Gemmatimonadales bacterium]
MADKPEVTEGKAATGKPGTAAGQAAGSAEKADLDNGSAGSADELDAPAQAVGGVPAEPAGSRAERLQRELDAVNDRYLRLAAEFDNFKKRVARERVELADRAQAAFVVRMLDVLDDLDRLVAGERSAASGEVIYDATVLINRKLRKELEAAGLEQIDPAGQPFDPTLHEAVSVVQPPDPSQDHTVSITFQTGYLFKGTLVRPARVQVYSDQGSI